MTDAKLWQPVGAALERWSAAGLHAKFWLRDDDAVEPSSRLDRLIALTARFEVPVALAVVPEQTGHGLAEELEGRSHVSTLVHGWAHRNYAGEGEKKQEFGPHRPLAEMTQDLARGLHRMKQLHPSRLVPIFVPPWNRIAPNVVASLGGIGYAALSRFGPARHAQASIAEINTHVDLIDFRGTRRCRDHALLAAETAQALSDSFEHGGYPVGILSHHLVNDNAAFDFLEALFAASRQHRWVSPRELIE
ncbi:MAG TPA: polysaccharide deacetylase family protein [Aestuariivirgaceae bacterium]|jgi:hypothetical protein